MNLRNGEYIRGRSPKWMNLLFAGSIANDANRDRNKDWLSAVRGRIEADKGNNKTNGNSKATKFLKATWHCVSPPSVRSTSSLSLYFPNFSNEKRDVSLAFSFSTLRHPAASFFHPFSPSFSFRHAEDPSGHFAWLSRPLARRRHSHLLRKINVWASIANTGNTPRDDYKSVHRTSVTAPFHILSRRFRTWFLPFPYFFFCTFSGEPQTRRASADKWLISR